jgi:hypothetical protein
MNRFRPNIVISSDQAFSESSWQKIVIGEITYSLVKPCSRCIITTTDQETGRRNPQQEPLKTLRTFRSFPGGIMFGENVIPEKTGTIKVGDPITVI